ncbi:4Fe-4S dicluster domain-containing protein [Caldicellulosiruptoraceae bacterium PP1]
MTKRIFPKEEYCLGCHLCEVYCTVAHSKNKKDIIKVYKDKKNKPTPRILIEEKQGNYVTFALQCRHCDAAPCTKACITGAMKKLENGTVICDEEKCVGCWSCILVCPHGAIRRGENKKVASKCDLCIELGEPACVKNCPNEALEIKEI